MFRRSQLPLPNLYRLLLVSVALGSVAAADVKVISSTVSGEVDVLGGGGATPYPLRDVETQRAHRGNATAAAFADTGIKIAEDGAGNFRGTGRGSGSAIATAVRSGLTLSGTGTVVAHFEATPDLGVGQSIDEATFRIDFIVTGTAVPYTLVANLTDEFESPDQVQLRRMDTSPLGVPVALCSSFSPNLNVSGTLVPGTYRLFGSVKAFESGGSVQSPGDETASYDYALTFGAGTVLRFTPRRTPTSSSVSPVPVERENLMMTLRLMLLGLAIRRM